MLDTLKNSDSKDLVAIKIAVGLSNKKWDTSIKGLTQKEVIKVVKNEEGLFIEMLN